MAALNSLMHSTLQDKQDLLYLHIYSCTLCPLPRERERKTTSFTCSSKTCCKHSDETERERERRSNIGILKGSRRVKGWWHRVLTGGAATRGDIPQGRWAEPIILWDLVPPWQGAANHCVDEIKVAAASTADCYLMDVCVFTVCAWFFFFF